MKHYIVVIVDPDIDENAVTPDDRVSSVKRLFGTPQIVLFISVLLSLTCFCIVSVRNVLPERETATPTTSPGLVERIELTTLTITPTPVGLICTCVTPVPTPTPACWPYIELIMTRMPDLLTPLPPEQP